MAVTQQASIIFKERRADELPRDGIDKIPHFSLSYMLISVPGIYDRFQISPAIFVPKPRGIYC